MFGRPPKRVVIEDYPNHYKMKKNSRWPFLLLLLLAVGFSVTAWYSVRVDSERSIHLQSVVSGGDCNKPNRVSNR